MNRHALHAAGLCLMFVCAPGVLFTQESSGRSNADTLTARIEPGPNVDTKGPAAVVQEPARGILRRLAHFYLNDWNAAPNTEPAPRRALDAPMDSPPFPSSDWGYGGSPTIGTPDSNVYPTMAALRREGAKTHLYGWVEASGNASTSSQTNYPLAYSSLPNRVLLNQAVVVLERQPDTMQTKHFDWGFHLSGLFGADYRYMAAKGYWSGQLLDHNRQYGFDPVWESLDLYFPVKEGLIVRAGRFLALPGIETQMSPGNFTHTHSLIFAMAPSTETGAVATLKLTKQWMIQAGISAGHDVAPWTVDRTPSALACLNYSTRSNHDNIDACASGINGGHYAYNNVQHFDAVWNHRFNSKWNTATEGWVMYERDVPNVANRAHPILPVETGANGAFCATGQASCFAPEYAMLNYLNRVVNSKLYVGTRNGFMNDKKGQRTGVPGRYTANTIYVTKTFGSTVMLRSDLRFDHSWDRQGYDNGTKRSQLLFTVDLVYKF